MTTVSLHRIQGGTSIGVDARVMGNEARFINNYRGIRNRPNAEFVDGRHSGELRMGIWNAGEAIGKGEEIVHQKRSRVLYHLRGSGGCARWMRNAKTRRRQVP